MPDRLIEDLQDICDLILSGNKTIIRVLTDLTPEQTEYFQKFIGFWLDKTDRLDNRGRSLLTDIKYDL